MDALSTRRSDLGAALIVEDDAHMRALVAGMARDIGFNVTIEVASVADALDHLMFDMVRAVLVDLSLRDEDGLELINAMRSHPRSSVRSLPVVVISRTTTETRIRDTIKAGADGFIAKPLTIATFSRQMYLALENAARRTHSRFDQQWSPVDANVVRRVTFDID